MVALMGKGATEAAPINYALMVTRIRRAQK